MKIYYVVEKQLESDGQVEYTTGLKDIILYKIVKNTPIVIGELKCASDELGVYFKTNHEEISDYIDEFLPEYNSDKCEFIQL